MVPPVRPQGGSSLEPGILRWESSSTSRVRPYDDFNLLARRVGEISSDLTEIQHELTGLVRVVREDAGGVQRLSGELRGQITPRPHGARRPSVAPFVRMVGTARGRPARRRARGRVRPSSWTPPSSS
jgi:hypothetical protein